MLFFRRFVAPVLLAIAVTQGASQPAAAYLDKTRFVLHLGVAYFCFHHWVLTPYRAGAFAPGAPHRLVAITKGGLALLFAVHEVRVAEAIARKSNDPLLRRLDSEIAGLSGTFGSIGERLKAGHFDPSDLNVLDQQAGTLSHDAAAGGAVIKDVPVALPSH